MRRAERLREETAFQDLAAVKRWPSADAREWVTRLVSYLCAQPQVRAVVLYGSAVRDVEDSADVDLLFVYEGYPPIFESPPLDVDVRGYESTEIDAQIAAGHDVLGWALRFGAPVWERSRFWSDLVARWRLKLPLPLPETAEARAEKAGRYYQELSAAGDDEAARDQLLTMLTQQARARLLRAGVFPGSRPELPAQLFEIGEGVLADRLSQSITARVS